MPKLDGKIALVTGASRGIGYATAKALAKEGAHVIAVARTVGGLEELDDDIKALGGSATLVPQDLRDGDALDKLGGAIYERWGLLDIFIANAAILGPISPLGHIEVKEFENVFKTNVTANWRMLRSLDPLLRKSNKANAVFLTASAAQDAKPFWGLYGSSKAALEAMVKTYAAEVAKTSINVSLLDPGPVRTQLRARALPGEDKSALQSPGDAAEKVLDIISP